ncbi:MAG: hypothetical protein ACI4P4_04990 [Faecousia sp.]
MDIPWKNVLPIWKKRKAKQEYTVPNRIISIKKGGIKGETCVFVLAHGKINFKGADLCFSSPAIKKRKWESA